MLSGFPWSSSSLVQFLSMVFYPLTAALQRLKCLRYNIDGPWFVAASISILALFSTIQMQSVRYLPVSISHSIHQSSLIMWCKMNRQNNGYCCLHLTLSTGTSYPSSCLFMYFFAHGGSSFITSRNICFSVHSGLWMTEHESFHGPRIYTFVQRTIFFE